MAIECDAMVDVNLIRPLNKVKVHWSSSVVTCVLQRRDSWSFLERGQNMAIEALPSKDLVSGTVYEFRPTCWAASSRWVPR